MKEVQLEHKINEDLQQLCQWMQHLGKANRISKQTQVAMKVP